VPEKPPLLFPWCILLHRLYGVDAHANLLQIAYSLCIIVCMCFAEGIDVVKLNIPQSADLGIELSGTMYTLYVVDYMFMTILFSFLLIFCLIVIHSDSICGFGTRYQLCCIQRMILYQ